jgi:hypothetical protein
LLPVARSFTAARRLFTSISPQVFEETMDAEQEKRHPNRKNRNQYSHEHGFSTS